MAAWSCKTLKILWAIFAFFWKTTPYGKILKILFRKFSPPYQSTLLCSNVVKFVRREIGEIVRYLPDQNKKKTKFRLPLQLSLLRGSRPKLLRQGQPPTMYWYGYFIKDHATNVHENNAIKLVQCNDCNKRLHKQKKERKLQCKQAPIDKWMLKSIIIVLW